MSVIYAACTFCNLTGVYVTSMKNASPNAQSLPFSCCQLSLKASRSGLVYNSLTLCQPTCCTIALEYGHINYILWVFVPVVLLQRYSLQLLLGGSALSVAHDRLMPDSQHCQLSVRAVLVSTASPGPPLLPLEFYAILGGVHLSLVTLKGHIATATAVYIRYRTSERKFQATPAVTT